MKSLQTINNSLLIDVVAETEELGNGLNVEARNSSRRKIIKGTVIKTCSDTIVEGDVVYFPLYSGDEISLLGKTYYLINLDDVKIIERI